MSPHIPIKILSERANSFLDGLKNLIRKNEVDEIRLGLDRILRVHLKNGIHLMYEESNDVKEVKAMLYNLGKYGNEN